MKSSRTVIAAFAAAVLVGSVPATASAALDPMLEKGTGTARSIPPGDPGCAGTERCVVWDASAHGTPIDNGRFRGKALVVSGEFYTNHRGDSCVPVHGTARFVAKRRINKIKLAFEGSGCAAEFGNRTSMRAVYKVTGGTGRFQGARGRGGFVMSFFETGEEGVADVQYRLDGTIRY